MTNTKHTPTQKVTLLNENYKSKLIIHLDGTFNDLVLQTDDSGIARQKIAEIVRAVNSHEELLKALKRIQKALTQSSGPESVDTYRMCEVIQSVVDDAIAKAEGR